MPSLNNSQTVMSYIKRRKSNLIKLFDSKCCICGFNAFQEALEFHHVDPSTKEFGLSASSTMTKSLDKQIIEAKKCVLVCSNCHRGIHAGYIKIPENWQSFFREDIEKQLLDEIEITKHGQKNYCIRCGKEILSSKAKYCPECKHFMDRVVERPSREELKQLIRTKKFTEIATLYGVSDNAIRKWCDLEGLPRKKTDIKNISDKDWELI